MARLVVISGASGSGKSTVGHALADKEEALFVEGDDYHCSESVRKMSRGQPLTDQDRLPWLETLHGILYKIAARVNSQCEGEGRVSGVLACSALRRKYRDILIGRGLGVKDICERCVVVQLTGSVEVLESRVTERPGHFMPASLVASQLNELEPLAAEEEWPCLTLNITSNIETLIESIQKFISSLCKLSNV